MNTLRAAVQQGWQARQNKSPAERGLKIEQCALLTGHQPSIRSSELGADRTEGRVQVGLQGAKPGNETNAHDSSDKAILDSRGTGLVLDKAASKSFHVSPKDCLRDRGPRLSISHF